MKSESGMGKVKSISYLYVELLDHCKDWQGKTIEGSTGSIEPIWDILSTSYSKLTRKIPHV